MPSQPNLIYWDSCVFLSYINGNPDRVATIESLLDQVKDGHGARKIVTSTIAMVEVAHANFEKDDHRLSPAVEARLDDLWNDTSVIVTIDVHDEIIRSARKLMRDAITRGRTLKPIDAIHLASAKYLCVGELHTYDGGHFEPFAADIGCPVCQPHVEQPRLLMEVDS